MACGSCEFPVSHSPSKSPSTKGLSHIDWYSQRLYQEQIPIILLLEVEWWLGKLSVTDWAIAAALMGQLSNKKKDVKNMI